MAVMDLESTTAQRRTGKRGDKTDLLKRNVTPTIRALSHYISITFRFQALVTQRSDINQIYCHNIQWLLKSRGLTTSSTTEKSPKCSGAADTIPAGESFLFQTTERETAKTRDQP